MAGFFRLLSRIPLAWAHALGAGLGWLVFLLSPVYRQRFRDHAALAGLGTSQWRAAVGAAGQVLTELPRLWFGAPVPVVWQGERAIETALAAGRGVLFLTPHLGSFEVTAQAYARRYGALRPMTVLFRPPRKPWLQRLVRLARERPGLRTAPTSLAGVRQLVRALRRGECVGLLPDQVPPLGQGDWQPFFGRPAYTMTLAHRLAQQSGATVLLAWGERLPRGRGYGIRVQPAPLDLAADPAAAGRQINRALEALIRTCPQQYLWGYARYKPPRDTA